MKAYFDQSGAVSGQRAALILEDSKPSGARVNDRLSRKTASLLEAIVGIGLLEMALWSIGSSQFVLGAVLLGWVAVSSVRSGRSAREMGVTAAGFRREWPIVPAALGLAALMMLVAARENTLHGLHGLRTPVWHAALYAIWAFVQQFLAQSFIFVRFEEILGSGKRAVLATSAVFCIAHLPSPILMFATLAMCLVWSELFRRFRNIYPLAIAHAILGLALAVSLPDWATHHMRVGLAYWFR